MVAVREVRQDHGHVGEVERAQHAVDQPQRDQEEGRTSQVEDDVDQSRPHTASPGSVHHQAVGCQQQHLEKHEQVEQVAGEEGAVKARYLQQEQGMEVAAGRIRSGSGVEPRWHRDCCRQSDHERRQTVENEDDAERRRPGAEGVDHDAVVAGHVDQPGGSGNEKEAGSEKECPHVV